MLKILLSLIICVSLTGCSSQLESEKDYIQRSFITMGTTVTIVIKENTPLSKKIISEASAKIKEISIIFDRFSKDSEIAYINNNAADFSVELSSDLEEVLLEAMSIHASTSKAYDITVGPLQKLWGFYDLEAKNEISPKKIQDTLKSVGMDKLKIEDGYISFLNNNMHLDFSSLAKGYVIDKAAQLIRNSDIKDAIIDAGGDIVCIGDNKTFGWNIGIRDPLKKNKITAVINVTDKAVATSGGYEKFLEISKKKYAHILDPRTGLPVKNNIVSSTVISDKGVIADGYATAFFVLPVKESMQIVQKDDRLECVLITKENNGKIKFWISSGIKDSFTRVGEEYAV